MNYYERIQASIDFIETHLTDDFTVEQAAKEACMSMATFYRFFLSIAGFTVKDYIRRRRLYCAADEILHENKIIDVATKFGYSSSDAFSRAFKKEMGLNPSDFKEQFGSNDSSRKLSKVEKFKRLNIMEEYFEMNDAQLMNEYPDIKLIKKLPQMKTACFKYFGPDPEVHAFLVMKEWIRKNGIHLNSKTETGESAYRIFGFNNPDPSDPENQEEIYGYEVCVTIDDVLYETLKDAPVHGGHESYPCVMRKTLQGGRYAVVSVKRDKNGDIGFAIMKAWQRFSKWMELSRFIWGGQQYLEEHLGFSDEDEHLGGVDLYMPIQEPNKTEVQISPDKLIPETIPLYKVAAFHVDCDDFMKGAHKVWQLVLEWIAKVEQSKKISLKDSRVFMFGSGFKREPPFFHEILITLPAGVSLPKDLSSLCEVKDFSGGKYMTVTTDDAHQMQTWAYMEQWRKESKTKGAKHQWVSEWILDSWKFPEKAVKVCYPIG